ncbi:hypothetical protein VZ95_14520 [Elstera litoralis]|uniref:Uncharacterized protein n=1 Tax=Elstera litoralis TaxID=552518 RepID=A0A0F3IQE5_9PROT|nr:hypothetical protein [Elstera litoralis]KJV08951.1 hypothetical protein VZ95_14520 [Elstera litoralis]
MTLDLPALTAERDAWNTANPPGTWVKAWLADFGPIVTTTRLPAALLGSGQLVVWLHNVDKAVPITAVTPIDPPTEADRVGLIAQHPWNTTDERDLLARRLRGESFRQIADDLGRPPLACEERYQQIRQGAA